MIYILDNVDCASPGLQVATVPGLKITQIKIPRNVVDVFGTLTT
jgi:hypothetical protein